MQKIIFIHLSGSRRDQVDTFPAGDYELIIGRDPSAHVRFDQDRDDLVSRQHIKIIRDPWDANGFQVVDLQSRNGSFLNQQRVFGSARLSHNDVIQLGAGGPEFRFEVDPPPPVSAGGARETTIGLAAAPGLKPTRESWLPGPPGKPQPIGRGTVERMLGDVFTRVKKQSTRGIWLIGIAAFTVVLLLGSGTYFLFRRTQIKISSDLSTAQAKNDAAMARAQQEAEKSDEAEKQVAQLEAELQASNRRNDANHQALMAELEKARKEAEAQKAALALTRRESANSAAQLQSLLKQQQAAPAPAPVSKPETADPSKFDDLRRQIESQIDAKFEQDPAAAQDLADQLIQADAKRYEGYALAGRIASKRGDFRRAADMYQRAVDRAPADIRPSLEKQLEAARSLIP